MAGKEGQRGYQSREHLMTKMSTINFEHLLTIFTFVHRKICRAYLQILRWIFVEDIRFFFTSSQKKEKLYRNLQLLPTKYVGYGWKITIFYLKVRSAHPFSLPLHHN